VSRYSVTLDMRIACDDDQLDTFTDALYEHLLALDPTADMGGSLTEGTFELTVQVEAPDAAAAASEAAAVLRAAAHAAGGSTAGWTQRSVSAREVLAPAG